MLRTEPKLYLVPLFFALELMGCKPEIGDECTVSTDCSAAGERLCDTTQPGGYCTIFNCEPGTCPEEAICISYGSMLSTVPACRDRNRRSRYEETYCVAKCEEDDDCRGGYACIDMGNPNNAGGVVVVEHGTVDSRVCVVPYSGMPIPPDRSTEVCTGSNGPFKEPPDAGSDAEPDAGTDALPDAESDGESADATGDAATE